MYIFLSSITDNTISDLTVSYMVGVLQQELLALREHLGPPCFFVASVVFIILVFVLFLFSLSSFCVLLSLSLD